MAFPSFPSLASVGSRVLAQYRIMNVDPDNGNDMTADGWGAPFATIQAAIDYIVANRTGGKKGVDNEWWGVEVAVGTYDEDIAIPGWVEVFCRTPRGARITGAAEGAGPIVLLEGGADAEDPEWKPCALANVVISRDDTDRDDAYAIEAGPYAGNSGGSATLDDAAFVQNCLIICTPNATPTTAFLKGLHAHGGFLRIDHCDLEISPAEGVEMLADTATMEIGEEEVLTGGLFAFTYTSNSCIESAPIRLVNEAVRRELALGTQKPVPLVLFHSFDSAGARIEGSIDTDWTTARGVGAEDDFGYTILCDGATVASVNFTYTPDTPASDPPNCVCSMVSYGGGASLQPSITSVTDAIQSTNVVVEFVSQWSSGVPLPVLVNSNADVAGLPYDSDTTGNLTSTNAALTAALRFSRDLLAKGTAGMPRGGALVTVSQRYDSNTPAGLYADGADYYLGSDPAENAVTLQAAINAAAITGGVVQIGPGSSDIARGGAASAILEVPTNVTLRGMGRNATVLVIRGTESITNSAGILLNGDSCVLENLGILVNADADVDAVVVLSGGPNHQVQSVNILAESNESASLEGVVIDGTSGNNILVFTAVSMGDSAANAIRVADGSTFNHISGCTTGADYGNVTVEDGSENNNIHDNDFVGNVNIVGNTNKFSDNRVHSGRSFTTSASGNTVTNNIWNGGTATYGSAWIGPGGSTDTNRP